MRANITIVPASRMTVDSPAAFASKGQRIIQVHHPLHSHGIRAHICLPDDVFVARDACPPVRTRAQHGQLALSIHFRDGRLSRHAVGTGEERPSNLGYRYPICIRSSIGGTHVFTIRFDREGREAGAFRYCD
ncbi:MAG: hypothetical protein WCE97_01570 [Candidatus Cybelea sp.]